MGNNWHHSMEFLGCKVTRNNVAFLTRLKTLMAYCQCDRCQEQLAVITKKIKAALAAPRKSDLAK